ncbi:MAG TPA: RICIN domain-containing protein, partial [Burkholderiaceae bacterium]
MMKRDNNTERFAGKLKPVAALLLSCSGAVLLSGCGGQSASVPEATAKANEQGRRTIEAVARAAAKVSTSINQIISNANGACTEAVASSWDIQLNACGASDLQKFQFMPVASGTDVYLLKNVSTGLCVTTTGSSSGSFVELDTCSGATTQQFQVSSVGTNLAQLINQSNKLCLDAPTATKSISFSSTTCASSNKNEV